MTVISFEQLYSATQGHLGVVDAICPVCGPDRRSPINRSRKVLRLWCDGPGFISYRCARCEIKGYVLHNASSERCQNDGIRNGARAPHLPNYLKAVSEDTRRVSYKATDDHRADFPLQIWTESISAEHPLLLAYLARRQLTLPDHHNGVLRFHPNCPFGEGMRHPCMIGLFRDIETNEPRAIHRTAITPDGRKIGPKSLGPIGGCAVKLSPDENVEQGLTVGEGIETTLAGMTLSFRPAWALGSAGAIARFPLLSGIDCLTILVDHDASGAGQESAMQCSRRWTSMGREVFRVVPTTVDTDMADIVRGVAA